MGVEMANQVVELLDRKIESLERRRAAMKALRDAVAQDPDFVTTVQDILLDPGSNGLPAPERAAPARQPDAPHFERLIHVLLSNGLHFAQFPVVFGPSGRRGPPSPGRVVREEDGQAVQDVRGHAAAAVARPGFSGRRNEVWLSLNHRADHRGNEDGPLLGSGPSRVR